MRFNQVPLLVKTTKVSLENPWDARIEFETTVYGVPTYGKLTIVADHQTNYRIAVDDERLWFEPSGLERFLRTLPADGFWVLVSGELVASGPADGELVAFMREGEAGVLPWKYSVEAYEIVFMNADVKTVKTDEPEGEEGKPGPN